MHFYVGFSNCMIMQNMKILVNFNNFFSKLDYLEQHEILIKKTDDFNYAICPSIVLLRWLIRVTAFDEGLMYLGISIVMAKYFYGSHYQGSIGCYS